MPFLPRLCAVLSLTLLGTMSIAQDGSSETVPSAVDLLQTSKQYEAIGASMEASELYSKTESLIDQIRQENKGKRVPEFITETSQKFAGLMLALDKKVKSGDPSALHYWAKAEIRTCAVQEEAVRMGYTPVSNASDCWQNVRAMFGKAHSKGVIESATMLGLMYQRGWGGSKSKYLSADWYLRAASEYAKANHRNNALLALEWAEEQVPDHPDIAPLKQYLLSSSERRR